jgi:putative alpha-1,2-mannosidase
MYVASRDMMNGKPLIRPWFSHAQIASGATLVLERGDQPNTNWGAAAQDAPHSMSNPANAAE